MAKNAGPMPSQGKSGQVAGNTAAGGAIGSAAGAVGGAVVGHADAAHRSEQPVVRRRGSRASSGHP